MVSYLALRVSEDTDGYVPRWARDWTDHTTDRTALVFSLYQSAKAANPGTPKRHSRPGRAQPEREPR
jgi:hypothetical protein